jgi:hypothetical protein
MDGQLAFCGRENLPLEAICFDIADCSYLITCPFRHNSLVEAVKTIHSRHHQLNLHPCVASKASSDFGKGNSQIHSDHHSLSQCYRYAVRKIAALPVLLLDCVGDSCSSVACWLSSNPAVCSVGRARVRLECVPQHKFQLDGCGTGAGCDGGWRMVWNEKRNHRYSGRETPTCRVVTSSGDSAVRRCVARITRLQNPKEAFFQHSTLLHQSHPHQHRKSSARIP